MALTQPKLRDLIQKDLAFSADATDAAVADKALCRVRLVCDSPTGWATAGTDSTIIIGITDRAFLIDSIGILVVSTLAVEETTYTTLTFSKSGGADFTLTTVGTWALNAAGGGALTAGVKKEVTLTATAADRLVAAGSVLSVAKTHASTGTAIVANTKLVVEGYWA